MVKGPPYHPDPDNFDTLVSLTDRDFAILADSGVNVIRLGMMWPGVEPQPGQYNYTYLGVISRIAAGAAKHGIYTLLDMHQARVRDRDGTRSGRARITEFLDRGIRGGHTATSRKKEKNI